MKQENCQVVVWSSIYVLHTILASLNFHVFSRDLAASIDPHVQLSVTGYFRRGGVTKGEWAGDGGKHLF